MSFGMITYLFTFIFTETLQKMLKDNLIIQNMNYTDHYIKEKRKKLLA